MFINVRMQWDKEKTARFSIAGKIQSLLERNSIKHFQVNADVAYVLSSLSDISVLHYVEQLTN